MEIQQSFRKSLLKRKPKCKKLKERLRDCSLWSKPHRKNKPSRINWSRSCKSKYNSDFFGAKFPLETTKRFVSKENLALVKSCVWDYVSNWVWYTYTPMEPAHIWYYHHHVIIHNYECDYVINYTAANSMFTVLLFRILHTSITYYNLELLHSSIRNNAITLFTITYYLQTTIYTQLEITDWMQPLMCLSSLFLLFPHIIWHGN